MKRFIYVIIALLMMLSPFEGAFAAEKAKVLKVGIPKDEKTLTPYTYNTGYPGLDMVNLLYDNLFHLDENNQPEPWLVKDYTVSDDRLTYNFTLHDNVTWQDGKPLTANDVKFTIDYFLENPHSRFTNPLKIIDSVEVNGNNLTFVLSEANPNFMVQPLSDLPILPEHIWSQVSNPDEATNALGSGPYKLVEYKAGQYYKMQANKDYFKGEPPVGEIIFPIIEDSTAMYTALKAGEIDVITSSLSPELVEQFDSNPNLNVARGAGFTTTLFQINADRYPMTDTKFRQAISYAIDTQYLVDTVLLGYGELGSPGFIHPSSPYYNNTMSSQTNKEKAKELLAEAGFKDIDGDGFVEGQNGESIELVTLVHSSRPTRIRTAELITEWLNEVGINVEVRAMDSTTVVSLMWPDYDVSKGRDFDLGVWGWSSTLQLFPDRLIELFHSDPAVGSLNIGAFQNEEFDQLAEDLRETLDQSERERIINEMQIIVAEEAPLITLYYQEIINVYNPNVYDNYTFQLGKGIFNKMSFTVESKTTSKTNGEGTNGGESASEGNSNDKDTTSESGNSSAILLLVIVSSVIIGGAFLLKKKGKGNINKSS